MAASEDPRIRALLEEALDSGRTAEEVCARFPELLGEVRARLGDVRAVDEQLRELFPADGTVNATSDSDRDLPVVAGYEIQSVLGRGGMGVVYRARQLNLKRLVALKMLRTGRFASPHERSRFVREAEAAARMRSTHIVQIYDVGEADGHPYFTMELVDGGTLAEKLKGVPQPPMDAASLVATLAGAVEIAHQSGIVHRDLKPSNILMSADGTPKISDFGIARPMEGGPSITLPGDWLGTPSYMAPEQAVGGARAGCPPVDVYSLGAILYEMLTGRPPFRAATSAETQRQVIGDEPVSPSRLVTKLPRDLETICLKCLNKAPQRRYPTSAALADDLRRFLNNEPIAARPERRWERGVRWIRRRPTTTAIALGAIVLAGVGVSVAIREISLAGERRRALERWGPRYEYVVRLEQQGQFQEARAILSGISDAGSEDLRLRIEHAQGDLTILERLDAIRLNRAMPSAQKQFNDLAAADESYAKAFTEAQLWSPKDTVESAASRIAATPFRTSAVAAIDDWALSTRNAARRKHLLEITRRIDPDPWRDRVRDVRVWRNPHELADLARTANVDEQPIPLLIALGGLLDEANEDSIAFLRRVQLAHPTDFWINFTLAEQLDDRKAADAVGFYRAALALRPKTIAAYVNLGMALTHQERVREAIDTWEEAVKINPDAAILRHNLAGAYMNRSQPDRAGLHAREAIRIDPLDAVAHSIFGYSLIVRGELDEAVSHLKTAIAMMKEGDPFLLQAKAALESCDRYSRLHAMTPDVLAGRKAAEPGELADMADVSRWKGLHAAAARMYELALAGDFGGGDERRAFAQYYAACSWMLAAEGRAKDSASLTPAEREGARARAQAFLRGSLAIWTSHLAEGGVDARESVRPALDAWLEAPELAGVRDEKALLPLAAQERAELSSLWKELRNLREQAR